MSHPSPAPHRKRKRASSSAVINPLSHPPDTLKQFTLAGYPADEPLPSKAYPGFPHRPPRPRGHRKPRGSALPHDDTDNDDTSDLDHHRQHLSSSGVETAASDADIDTAFETDPDPDSGWKTTDADTDADIPSTTRKRKGNKSKTNTKDPAPDRRAHAYHARVGWLVAVVKRCLAEGDVATARRAFGLLARARVYGRKVDLRWERYWELGAECLLRERDAGRRSSTTLEEEEERLGRLKAYYEYLIQQYPFSKQHAASSANSVLDFQVALFSAEMEAAHASHRRKLERLQRGDGDDDDAMDVDEPMDYDLDGLREHDDDDDEDGGEGRLLPERDEHLRGLSRREVRLREKENELRLATLKRMLDVAERMDTVMETVPFSRDHELLRLRAMVALFVGDLYMPPAPRSKTEEREGKRSKAGQRVKAREFLRRIKDGGGELKEHDEQLLESLATDDEEDEEDEGPSVLPMFSSMGF
ncbi:hypothetical protein NEMBOFW57_007548 [Staphylotrichum longicolle]|uniref:Uncharacterized protein n=1 Tax=Staphylotrichum longicolle TaxID=669026 RepID=A0AAD4EUU5_9PEZI|nr:hypothetical protein NEMBOFW57_007548 [Staphylotrichum longicolle]